MPKHPHVLVAPDVPSGAISPDAVIHPGCRLSGAALSIGPGCELGGEGPVTIRDCQLGRNVRLAGGFFEQSTFLDGVAGGDQAHVRPACLLEEFVNYGHCCGFKQTILMPFVTAGSLANFCDVLMAGGTSRANHSEIGSSYVHFNFTPYRDKATPSLLGDVPRGVMLDQAPIFLGGQGGLVGPRRVAFGTLIPAGQVCRRDITREGCLAAQKPQDDLEVPYPPANRQNTAKVFHANVDYIGNLLAFDHWHRHVRAPFMLSDPWLARCRLGALARFGQALGERLSRLAQFVEFLAAEDSASHPAETRGILECWPRARERLADLVATRGHLPPPGVALPAGPDYITAVQSLAPAQKEALTRHLQCVARRAFDAVERTG